MSATMTTRVEGYVYACTPDRPTCSRHYYYPPCDPLIHSLAWVRMSTYHAWIDPERRKMYR